MHNKQFYLSIDPDRYNQFYCRRDTGIDLAQFAAENALVLGCGTGRETIPLISRGIYTTAIDISPRMLQHTKASLFDGELLNTFLLDAFNDKFDLGHFDLIAALHGFLMHAANEKELDFCLRNVRDSLDPRGIFICEVAKPHNLQFENFAYQYYAKDGTIRIFDNLTETFAECKTYDWTSHLERFFGNVITEETNDEYQFLCFL